MTLRRRISARTRRGRSHRKRSRVRTPRRREAQGKVKIKRENAEPGKPTRLATAFTVTNLFKSFL